MFSFVDTLQIYRYKAFNLYALVFITSLDQNRIESFATKKLRDVSTILNLCCCSPCKTTKNVLQETLSLVGNSSCPPSLEVRVDVGRLL